MSITITIETYYRKRASNPPYNRAASDTLRPRSDISSDKDTNSFPASTLYIVLVSALVVLVLAILSLCICYMCIWSVRKVNGDAEENTGTATRANTSNSVIPPVYNTAVEAAAPNTAGLESCPVVTYEQLPAYETVDRRCW